MRIFLIIVLFALVGNHVNCQMEMIRPIPLCVTSDTIREYRQRPSQLLLDTVDEAKAQTVKSRQSSTPGGGITNGKLKSVWYGKILTNAATLPETDAATEYQYYTMLNQWLHLQIKFSSNVKVVIVQAMVNPYGLPWGVFDLEFGCLDCGTGINLEDGKEGYALSYKGAATAIPCSKRTYINPRHPYVYVYDGGARNEFHLNFNFVDIPCRNMKMLQFLIISADDKSKEFARTAVIDHINQDSIDGMPYPYHVRFYKSYTCHKQQQNFKVVGSGDKSGITANADYERCVLASDSDFQKDHKDTQYYQSDWVCKKPERIRCEDYKLTRTNDPTHQNLAPDFQSLCVRCQDQRGLPYEEGPKQVLTKSDYLRRFHGFSMFFGMISVSVVSIHIARYFKETRGCCLLIGWWFWAHLVLMYAASGAILTGLLLGIFMPPRIELNDVMGLKDRRNRLRVIHYVIGILGAVVCYPACIAVGPIRPRISKKRMSYVWAHTTLGYLSVALGILATYFSTACFEVTMYAILTVVMGFVPYVMAFVIQYLMDHDSPLIPKRKYIPVIESAEVKSKLPMAIPRAVALGILVASTTMFVIFDGIYTWGQYGSAFGLDSCMNCIWKWDAPVEHQKEVRPLWDQYECPQSEFDEYLSKSKWAPFT